MYLSRVEIDKNKYRELKTQDIYHDWVERSFPEEFERNICTRKLWRTDKIKNKEYLLIVSKTAPNIEKMEKYGIKGTAEIKKYDIFLNNLKNGMKMRFRVSLNPVKSLSRGKEKGRGRLIPLVSVEHQMNFLYERSEKNGFKLEKDEFTMVNRQHKILNKNQNIEKRRPLRLAYVEYEGILEISDAEKFRKTLTEGIGKKKAYGFGMMTVIPI